MTTPDRTTQATVARLVAPRVALASCVRAWLLRSTVGAPPLPPEQRLNRFPATPYCAITWVIEGSAELVDPAPPGAVAHAGEAIFSGPRATPNMTYNPGPVHTLTVLFFADALHRLAGLDMAAQVDRITPLRDVLGEEWTNMSAALLAAVDDAARIGLLEDWLAPRWQAVRGDAVARWLPLRDWLQALAARAAAARAGRSARMAERRVRAWTGHPLRTLRRMARAEASLLAAREEERDGQLSLSDVAARAGYADQAHLSREARAMVGTSPRELIRLARTDESYWLYRIWQ